MEMKVVGSYSASRVRSRLGKLRSANLSTARAELLFPKHKLVSIWILLAGTMMQNDVQ